MTRGVETGYRRSHSRCARIGRQADVTDLARATQAASARRSRPSEAPSCADSSSPSTSASRIAVVDARRRRHVAGRVTRVIVGDVERPATRRIAVDTAMAAAPPSLPLRGGRCRRRRRRGRAHRRCRCSPQGDRRVLRRPDRSAHVAATAAVAHHRADAVHQQRAADHAGRGGRRGAEKRAAALTARCRPSGCLSAHGRPPGPPPMVPRLRR